MSGIKKDCFAYDKTRFSCRVLDHAYCKEGECNFYKTEKERCAECKEKYRKYSCEDCKKMGIK